MSAIQAFTIVDRRTSKPYTVRLRERPAVMSVHSHRNACYVAFAIEASESLRESDPYTLVSLREDPDDEDPKFHFLRAWEDFSTLLEDCKLEEMDAMFVTALETPGDGPIEFHGEIFSTEE